MEKNIKSQRWDKLGLKNLLKKSKIGKIGMWSYERRKK